ncbi:helix-turn-helix domain-containing protein [uncultured Draconibacterium sp.]|uniref:TetR/AcrR family transcriptional regulator n=1 Tax=uncultured Draconibacterium sp. TaxID=1573823 RepID=UPI0032179D38
MTEKQEKIIQAALQLFAQEGYNATSTSKVAKHAGVSEGLIFRHFKNKEGLLQAILNFGADKLKEIIVDIVLEADPEKVIRKAIELPASVDKSEYDFWKLQYKLKWELEINHDEKMEPLHMALSNAFRKLNYKSPDLEASLIVLYIDGIASSMLKASNLDAESLIQFLCEKYKV